MQQCSKSTSNSHHRVAVAAEKSDLMKLWMVNTCLTDFKCFHGSFMVSQGRSLEDFRSSRSSIRGVQVES